ncbi:MAG: restriction endonuclease subunit S [bacterium]|nr:restriction endonuclease subunit S [bacterium]
MTGKEQGKAWNNNTLDLPEGYRMTELGPLPEEWRVVRLGEVVSLTKGRKPPKLLNAYVAGALPYLTADYFRTGAASGWVPVECLSRMPLCSREDVVLIWDGSKAGQVFTGLDGVLASTMVRVTPTEDLRQDYLFFLLSIQFELLNTQTTGSTIPHVNKELFHNLFIPLPPLPEQRAIAHVLHAVQEAKETTERVIAAARELKRSLMRHLFTYGPVPVDQADQVPLQETEIGPIPAHWRVVRLGEVVSLTKGRKPPKLLNAYVAGALPYLTADYFRTGAASGWVPVECLSRMPLCSREDVVLIWDGSKAGQVFTGLDGVLASTMVRVTPTEDLRQDYLFFLLSIQFELLNTQTTGSTIPHVNKELFHNLFIPLPPLPEQQEIARILRAVDEKIQAEERRKEALEGLFKALLHHLMTARVRLPKEFIARFEEVTNHE